MNAVDDELATIANDWQFEKCARCLGPLRAFVNDGGAWSRDTSAGDKFVCAKCGNDEAMRQVFDHTVVPFAEWPILNGAHDFAIEVPA